MSISVQLPPVRHGDAFQTDKAFVGSAKREVKRLVRAGLEDDNRVLDVGCGYGRLAIGLLLSDLNIAYNGIDVKREAIEWCHGHITPLGEYDFTHIDVYNERYNKTGKPIDGFEFPFDCSTFDVIYAFSVLSHMQAKDADIYLGEIARVLDPGGFVFLTAFVRTKGPTFAVNPDDFYTVLSNSPLHYCVYRQSHLESLFAKHGLAKMRNRRKLSRSTQSAYFLRRK